MACAANFCRNHLKKTRRSEETRHIRYHYFPKDEQRKRQWIRFCDRGGDWYPLSKSTMCSVHFTEDSYERNLQAELLNIKAVKKLKLTAVPTLIDENDVQIVDERKVRVKKRENKRLVQELLDESASTQVDNLTSELQTVQGKEANMMQFGKKTNKVQDSKKNKSCRKGSFKGSRENLVLPDASYSGDTGGNNNCGDSCTDLCKSYLILEPTVILSTDTNAKREAGKKEGDPDKKPRKKKIKESNDDEVPRPETSTVRNKLRKRKLNCCAMGCQNTSDSCLMFIIPKDPTLRNRWVLNINRKGWQPNDQSAVCEMHFVSDWWEQDPLGGRSLKPDAVPTEYLTGDAWASGPSTASASGSGHEWTDNNWTETEGDEEMMDIEEHSVFIKQELMEPEVDLKEELDPEAPTEPVPGFETVFVNSTEFKDGDKSDFPPIKVEVEETEENESSDNETEPKVPRYSTVPSYLGSSSPVITSTSVLSCSSAPTVSVVTTFPSSVTTTTVSTVTGLMSTLPSPLMVPVIPNVTQKTAPGGVPAGHKQFIILCPQTVQKTLTTQSSTSSTQTTVAPLTSKQLQEMPKLIKPHGSHKVIGLTPVQASKIISATPIQSSQVRSPTPIQLPQAKNLIPIKLPPAKSLTPAQSSQAKSPTPTQLPQAKSPTPTQLPQPKSLTTTQSCQAESPPSQPTSSPPTQEAPPPSNQTNQEPQLVDNCYVETENSIKIDLSALPQALKAGIKEKVKYLLDAIFLKHINPKDIVIAFRQSKGAQFAILSA